jgi:hypothetical protein
MLQRIDFKGCCVYVCVFITVLPNTKLCAWGEEDSEVEDMCYEIRRAEACVD